MWCDGAACTQYVVGCSDYQKQQLVIYLANDILFKALAQVGAVSVFLTFSRGKKPDMMSENNL